MFLWSSNAQNTFFLVVLGIMKYPLPSVCKNSDVIQRKKLQKSQEGKDFSPRDRICSVWKATWEIIFHEKSSFTTTLLDNLEPIFFF